ncbi:MAG: hypothetical protein ACREMY_33740, partial [bacterium]
MGVEIASFARAAAAYSELTGVFLSKSALQRMVHAVGSGVVEQQSAEALAMVQVPPHETAVVWRTVPEPASAVMAISSDGVMVHLRHEGWKEVKTVSVSAVVTDGQSATGEPTVKLRQHSYRAGLWDAPTFTT